MFKEFMNFEYKRNATEAIGFYIVHFLIMELIVIITVNAMHIDSFNMGLKIGAYISGIYFTLLSFMILLIKRLYTSALAIILFLLTIIGAIYFGGLASCLFSTILSTFKTNDGE